MLKGKRGQGSEGGTAILGLILVLIVFGLVGYYFYINYTNIQSKTELLPKDISLFAQTCDTYGQIPDQVISRSNYCTQFTENELSGSTIYLSCLDNRVQAVIKNRVDCEGITERQTAIDKCKELNQTAVSKGKTFDGSKLIMNQLGSCKDLLTNAEGDTITGKTCSDVGGVWEPSGFNCDLHEASLDITNKVNNEKDLSDHKDQICCG